MSNRPIHIIAHGPNCPDGFAAAFIARRYFNSTLSIDFRNYDRPLPEFKEPSDLFFLDYAPKPAEYDELEKMHRLTVLDHHVSARRDLGDRAGYFYDVDRSGAQLTWWWFNGQTPEPWWLRAIAARDLWKLDYPHAQEISAYIASWPKTFEAWDVWTSVGEDHAVAEGGAILRFKQRLIEEHLTHVHHVDIDGLVVPACNVTNASCVSEVAGELAKQGVYGVAWHYDGRDTVVSLRSVKGGMDVSEVAKRHGGGGHANAAGYRQPHPLMDVAVSKTHTLGDATDYR